MLLLAYHGCDLDTAQKLLGGSVFQPSQRDYDWLGEGSYFWENDILRAYQWATEPRRNFSHPSVVGAAIELGHCLDLTTQSGIEAVKSAYQTFLQLAEWKGIAVPENSDPAESPEGDRVIRRLDCAVMNALFEIAEQARVDDPTSRSYDAIRALFPEGNELYPGAGFRNKTHIQICVRNPEQILGVFRVPEWQLREFGLTSLYGV